MLKSKGRGGAGDGAERDPAESLSEGDLLFLSAGGVSELRGGAEREQAAGGASQPPLPLHQWTQELLLPPDRTCTRQPRQVNR